MQRIGSLAMVTPENAFYRENWVKSGARPSPPQGGRFQERGVLPDLANAILAYASKGGSMGEVNRAVDRVNKAFVEKFGGGAAAPPAQDQLAYAARSVNAGVQEVLDRGMASLPKRPRKGSVRVSNGRLVFVSDKNASEGIVDEMSEGGSNNAIMFSLVGAGLGYALAPKNHGMAAGVGAVVGYIGGSCLPRSTLLK